MSAIIPGNDPSYVSLVKEHRQPILRAIPRWWASPPASGPIFPQVVAGPPSYSYSPELVRFVGLLTTHHRTEKMVALARRRFLAAVANAPMVTGGPYPPQLEQSAYDLGGSIEGIADGAAQRLSPVAETESADPDDRWQDL
jgi:hypothetical protein